MAVYHSKFAQHGTRPQTPRDHRSVHAAKRVATVIGVSALIAVTIFGFWRATLGTPPPAPDAAVDATQ